MKIETERLVLREKNRNKISEEDIKDITDGINNINISKWLLVIPYPYTRKDAKKWLSAEKKKNTIDFLIELKEEKKVIGATSLMRIDKFQGIAEVGYWLNENYHRRGYGPEALSAVLKYAFEKLKLRRIEADVFEKNQPPASFLKNSVQSAKVTLEKQEDAKQTAR